MKKEICMGVYPVQNVSQNIGGGQVRLTRQIQIRLSVMIAGIKNQLQRKPKNTAAIEKRKGIFHYETTNNLSW